MKENVIQKPKSVIINGKIHGEFKKFCRGKNLKIGAALEDLMEIFIHKNKVVQKLIDEYKENE